jgi:hypothetical protein
MRPCVPQSAVGTSVDGLDFSLISVVALVQMKSTEQIQNVSSSKNFCFIFSTQFPGFYGSHFMFFLVKVMSISQCEGYVERCNRHAESSQRVQNR